MNIRPQLINVLIACEESQRECLEFRELGFNAYSCDILKCGGKNPQWHIVGDVTPLLSGSTSFVTQDGKKHHLKKWHLIVAHPPCTYLCKVGAPNMISHGVLNKERFEKMMQARDFFFKCLNAKADYVAVENPRPMARARLPRPNAQASPHNFGSKYSKATYYWLRNLPPLMYGASFPGKPKSLHDASRGKYRSRTIWELAKAIAMQWGHYILDDLNRQ